jgi:hypothetical protein
VLAILSDQLTLANRLLSRPTAAATVDEARARLEEARDGAREWPIIAGILGALAGVAVARKWSNRGGRWSDVPSRSTSTSTYPRRSATVQRC